MAKNPSDSDTRISIKSFIKRADDTLVNHEENLKGKVSKDLFENEISHMKEKDRVLFKMVDKVEERLTKKIDDVNEKLSNQPGHTCVSESRIQDNRDEIMEANRSIRRLYIWQAGIGISLLVLFLTLGVGALSLVNRITFEVEENTEAIQKIEKRLEKAEEREKDDLKQAVKEALRESR